MTFSVLRSTHDSIRPDMIVEVVNTDYNVRSGFLTYLFASCRWRLLYRIDRRRVYVIALLDSRRNLKDILLERLINAE